jgi:hypothetical protein
MINGSVLRIIPGKFLIFDAPDPSIPAGQLYQDVGGRRHFRPEFYADLLQHLGVRLVLRLGAADYDPAPFARRGIRVCGAEDVACGGGAGGGGEEALGEGAFDRFSALAQAAGGSVAVHGGRGGGGRGAGLTLIAGWMMRHQYFGSPDVAAAWIRIALGAAAPVDRTALRRHWHPAACHPEDDLSRHAAAATLVRTGDSAKPPHRHGSPGRTASTPVSLHTSHPAAARHRWHAPAGAFSHSSPAVHIHHGRHHSPAGKGEPAAASPPPPENDKLPAPAGCRRRRGSAGRRLLAVLVVLALPPLVLYAALLLLRVLSAHLAGWR